MPQTGCLKEQTLFLTALGAEKVKTEMLAGLFLGEDPAADLEIVTVPLICVLFILPGVGGRESDKDREGEREQDL